MSKYKENKISDEIEKSERLEKKLVKLGKEKK
jgi:hypothetical protein